METRDPSAAERAVHGLCVDLSSLDIDEMRGLLARHFDGVDEETFARDLAGKSHVLRVWNEGRLIGFSTLVVHQETVRGEVIHVLYSGDTIMDPEGWGSPVLARGWIRMVRQVKAGLPPGRCFWLLLSAGFRTYRLLPVFWRNFWPRHDAVTPEETGELMETIASRRFGRQYDAEAGKVRFDRPHRLRGLLAVVPEGRRRDPHISFFLDGNPGWSRGDELVCLTEIDDRNLTSAGRRMVRGLVP